MTRVPGEWTNLVDGVGAWAGARRGTRWRVDHDVGWRVDGVFPRKREEIERRYSRDSVLAMVDVAQNRPRGAF